MRPRILVLQQEWPREFMRSTQWSYVSSLGYVDALQACGARVTLLTTPWFRHADALLAGEDFDQAWLIDLVHLEPDAALWERLRARVPVRVGLLGESLEYSAEEVREEPRYGTRERDVLARLPDLTHVLPVDECDARRLREAGVAACWTPAAMLESLVVPAASVDPAGPAGFIGALYPKRVRFFARPELRSRVRRVQPLDRTPGIERRYAGLASLCEQAAGQPLRIRDLHERYTRELLEIRREIFVRYLQAYSQMGAALNPPSLVKSYPGRVFEAAARGVPVVTARVPARPGAERLFADGKEILIVDEDDTAGWEQALDRLAQDRPYAREIALRARDRLLADHTLEARCRSALAFVAAHGAAEGRRSRGSSKMICEP